MGKRKGITMSTPTATHAEGTATMPQGENTIVVEHGLAGTPSTVTAGPFPEQYFSWIDNINEVSFQAYIHVPAEQDIDFPWSADL
jgi:hypothetical protein